jgi:uncharacterized membrane protein
MSDPPSQPPPSGGITGLLDRALAFAAGGPWKAVFIIALIIVGGGGYIVYEKRDELLENWLTPSAPQLVETNEIVLEIEKLIAENDIDLVQVWKVVGSNQQFVAARRKDGERPVIPEPRILPIMDRESDPKNVAAVLAGYPRCLDLTTAGTALARRLADRNYNRGCAVAIPPDGGQVLGVMYLVWHDARDESVENVSKGAAREISRNLATH